MVGESLERYFLDCDFLLTKNVSSWYFSSDIKKKLNKMIKTTLFNGAVDKKVCVPVAMFVLLGHLFLKLRVSKSYSEKV